MTPHPPVFPFGLHLSLALAAVCFRGQAQEKTTFQDHVLPLVENHCGKCHNPDRKKADLDVSTYAGVMKGGASGPVVVSGNLDGSKLWKVLTHAEEPFMPPSRPKLSDQELEVFKKWITGGLLETAGSKAVAAAKPTVDLTLKAVATGKPDGPPPMPRDLCLEPVRHTRRGSALTGLAASPWAPLVAVGGHKQVLLFHSESRELLGVLPFTEGAPATVAFSRNAKLLLAGGGRGGQSGRALLWDVESGEKLTTLGDEFDTVLAADLSPDQSKVALGGPGRLVKIHSTRTGELLAKIKKHTDWVTALAFSPSGEFLASGDRNGGLSVWDPDNGQEILTLPGHKAAITAVSWRDDSKLLASSSEDGSIRLWETQEGKSVKNWTAHGGGALSLSYARDGRLVSCGRDNQIILWDGNGGKVRALEAASELPLRAVFTHDDARVVATDFGGRVLAWNTADGKRLGEFDANPLPLGEQRAAVEAQIQALEPRVAQGLPALQAAEAEFAQASAQLQQAQKALDAAKAEQTAKENEVVRLKELAAQSAPPGDLQTKLTEARAVRQKARDAAAQAAEAVKAKTQLAEASKAKQAKLHAQCPAAALAEARMRLAQLKAAVINTELSRLREASGVQRRAHDRLVALAQEKRAAATQAQADAQAARAAIAQAKEKEATSTRVFETSFAEAQAAESEARKLAADLAAQDARLKEVRAAYEQAKAAAAGVQR